MTTTKQPFLHERILHDLEQRIMSGQWPPGHAVPFEVDLAKAYNCSRMTVNKVLSQLARNGLIERRRRAGSRVARPCAESAVMDIRTVESEVLALGVAYNYHLLRREIEKTRAGTPFTPGGPLLVLRCLHLAGEEPFCLEKRCICLDIVPEAATTNFAAIPPGTWLLEQVPWSAASHVIRADAADADTALALGMEKGRPCLVFERETRTTEGRVITSARFTYPGQRHSVRARFTPADKR